MHYQNCGSWRDFIPVFIHRLLLTAVFGAHVCAVLCSSLPLYHYACVSSAFSIDCAGILKLRNSDIELRKGETDIGRKNTRVRVVFRVHIPQPNGKVLSLQAASIPVECCEWLTHSHMHSYPCMVQHKNQCPPSGCIYSYSAK